MAYVEDLLIALLVISTFILIFLVNKLSSKVSKQEQQIISLARGLQVALYYLSNPESSKKNLENVKKFYYQNFVKHLVKKEVKWYCSNCGAENLQEENHCFECNSQQNNSIN